MKLGIKINTYSNLIKYISLACINHGSNIVERRIYWGLSLGLYNNPSNDSNACVIYQLIRQPVAPVYCCPSHCTPNDQLASYSPLSKANSLLL